MLHDALHVGPLDIASSIGRCPSAAGLVFRQLFLFGCKGGADPAVVYVRQGNSVRCKPWRYQILSKFRQSWWPKQGKLGLSGSCSELSTQEERLQVAARLSNFAARRRGSLRLHQEASTFHGGPRTVPGWSESLGQPRRRRRRTWTWNRFRWTLREEPVPCGRSRSAAV